LMLYATAKVLKDIMTGYRLQQEIVGRVVRKADPSSTVVSILSGEAVNPKKMPKRSVFLSKTKRKKRFLPKMDEDGDDGWTISEFMQPMAMIQTPPRVILSHNDLASQMDEKEFKRLTNDKNGMFKKWSDIGTDSAIARFMRNGLEPRRVYTKKEITDLCKEYGIQLVNLTISGIEDKHRNGKIMYKNGNNYAMYSCLLETFEKYF